MDKIGILYICTGKYDLFWKEFYKSCEQYFLKNCEKHYYIFTDAENIYDEENNKRIHKIYQENLGWPDNTLKRFSIFNKNKLLFNECDYLFFMNANLLFLSEVDDSFLPKEENLLVVKHPGYYNKSRDTFEFEKNKKSLAYISNDEGNIYVAGGLNGGKTKEFLKLIKQLDDNINKDLENGIVAIWHDESHINKYIINRNDLKVLEAEYLYPESWRMPFKAKILVRDKRKLGGGSYLRGNENKKLELECDEFTMRNLERKISKYPDYTVGIYGTGEMAVEIMDYLKEQNTNILKKIAGFIDRDSELIGYYLYDLKIDSIAKAEDGKFKAIIIASKAHEEEIYLRIKYLEDSNVDIIKVIK